MGFRRGERELVGVLWAEGIKDKKQTRACMHIMKPLINTRQLSVVRNILVNLDLASKIVYSDVVSPCMAKENPILTLNRPRNLCPFLNPSESRSTPSTARHKLESTRTKPHQSTHNQSIRIRRKSTPNLRPRTDLLSWQLQPR